MKIIITESQYETLLNELGPHDHKELKNLLAWVSKFTICDVEHDPKKIIIRPPIAAYPEIYQAHNTVTAIEPILGFIANVYGQAKFVIYQDWKNNRSPVKKDKPDNPDAAAAPNVEPEKDYTQYPQKPKKFKK